MSLAFDASLAARGFSMSIEVQQGETLAVLGPNGAGKSTLLGLIAGLLRPDSGRAKLGDTVLFDHNANEQRWLAPHQRGVAMLAQEPLLFPHLSVHANVAFGPRSAGSSRAAAAVTADRWLTETDTLDFADRRPHELSGGQAQRVAIARALAAEPSLLLLDEPFAALDVTATVTLRRMLRQVTANRTTIIVTHDALDAFLLADRVIVLNDGGIVEEGPTREVLERPKQSFTAELVGLTLLTGRRTPHGLVTADGVEIMASAGAPRALGGHETLGKLQALGTLGEPVAAALRPSAVRVARLQQSGGTAHHDHDHHNGNGNGNGNQPSTDPGHEAGNNTVIGTVHDLEPRGDLIRVRTEWLAADLQPSRVADLDLAPGVPIALSFSPDDVELYPTGG